MQERRAGVLEANVGACTAFFSVRMWFLSGIVSVIVIDVIDHYLFSTLYFTNRGRLFRYSPCSCPTMDEKSVPIIPPLQFFEWSRRQRAHRQRVYSESLSNNSDGVGPHRIPPPEPFVSIATIRAYLRIRDQLQLFVEDSHSQIFFRPFFTKLIHNFVLFFVVVFLIIPPVRTSLRILALWFAVARHGDTLICNLWFSRCVKWFCDRVLGIWEFGQELPPTFGGGEGPMVEEEDLRRNGNVGEKGTFGAAEAEGDVQATIRSRTRTSNGHENSTCYPIPARRDREGVSKPAGDLAASSHPDYSFTTGPFDDLPASHADYTGPYPNIDTANDCIRAVLVLHNHSLHREHQLILFFVLSTFASLPLLGTSSGSLTLGGACGYYAALCLVSDVVRVLWGAHGGGLESAGPTVVGDGPVLPEGPAPDRPVLPEGPVPDADRGRKTVAEQSAFQWDKAPVLYPTILWDKLQTVPLVLEQPAVAKYHRENHIIYSGGLCAAFYFAGVMSHMHKMFGRKCFREKDFGYIGASSGGHCAGYCGAPIVFGPYSQKRWALTEMAFPFRMFGLFPFGIYLRLLGGLAKGTMNINFLRNLNIKIVRNLIY